jgi:hypothetical protein
MKRKNAKNYFFREVQALETLLGISYNRRRRKSWEDITPTQEASI